MRKIILAAGLMLIGAMAGIAADRGMPGFQAQAQPPGINRSILQRVDVPGSNYEVVLATAAIPEGVASIGRHIHHGVEMGVEIEGTSTLTVDGAGETHLASGESYMIPAGVPHDVSTGNVPGKVVAVFVIEKGKPLATPAP